MTTPEDYIKLAEDAESSAIHVINAMAEKYPLGADFERYNDDIRKMVEFCSDERNPAMAKALIERIEGMKRPEFETLNNGTVIRFDNGAYNTALQDVIDILEGVE